MATQQSRLEILITASAESAKAEFAAIQTHLAALEKSHGIAAAAADKHAKSIDSLAGGFKRLQEAAAIIFSVSMFEKLINDAVTFTTDVQKLSTALNGNVEAGSAWVAVAEKTGVQVSMLARGFATFSTEADKGSGALKEIGVATQDSSGHLRSMNEILHDTVDWFHANAGATNEAAIAKTLFGRASADILPILEQGNASLAAITEEAKRYGLILNSETLQRQLAMNYQLKAGEEAVRGLAINLGMALLPAVAAAGQGLSNFVANHLQQLINGINQAVSYIIGIGEAFGLWDASASAAAVQLGQVTQATNNYGEATGGATNAAKNNAAAQRQVTEAARDATAAIDAQIRAITDQETAFTAGIAAQVKALTDAQNLTNFDANQTKIKKQEADKQKEIIALKHDAEAAGLLGNFTEQERINDAIVKAQEEIANLEISLTANSASEQSRLKIDALHTQETARKADFTAQKLQLEDQKKAIAASLQEQIARMQEAANAGVAANQAAGLSIPPIYDAAGKDAADKFKFAMSTGAEQAGKQMGDKLKTMDWKQVGGEIGRQIGEEAATSAGHSLQLRAGQAFQDALISVLQMRGTPTDFATNAFGDWLKHEIGWPGYAAGGMVNGPMGAPQLAIVHGGERVLTPAQQASGGGGGMDDYRIVDRLDTLIAVLSLHPTSFATTAYGR